MKPRLHDPDETLLSEDASRALHERMQALGDALQLLRNETAHTARPADEGESGVAQLGAGAGEMAGPQSCSRQLGGGWGGAALSRK